MRLSFRLSKRDLVSLHKQVSRRLTIIAKANSKLFVANCVAWIPMGIACATYFAMYRKYPDISHDLNVVLAVIAVSGISLWASVAYKQRIYREAILAENGWLLTEQTFEAQPECLSIENHTVRASYRWTAFIDCAEDETNLYLFIDNAQALILPKAAVGSDERLAQIRSWSQIETKEHQ